MKRLVEDHSLPQLRGVVRLYNPTFLLPKILHRPLIVSSPNLVLDTLTERLHTLEWLADTISIGECSPVNWHPNDQFTRMYPLAHVEVDGSINRWEVGVIGEQVSLMTGY
jgi:hypothetical protein